MSRNVKILLAAVAALIAFFWWRRRAQAEQAYGVTAGTPSPYTAITAMQTNVQQLPGLATRAAVEYIGSKLPPIVGQGLNAIIPQSTPRPPDCPPGFVGYHPGSPNHYCAGSVAPGGKTSALIGAIKTNLAAGGYNPNAGYYG